MLYFLDFIDKHASVVLPVGVLIGVFVPFLAEAFQSLLMPALLLPLTLSLVRIETLQLRKFCSQWQLVALLSVWILLFRPVAIWLILKIFTLPEAIVKAAIITAAAPPVTACAAIALYLGVNAAITVVTIIATMFFVPFTLPLIVGSLTGLHLKTGLWHISMRLTSFIFAAFLIAALTKKLMGITRIQQHAARLDGISVIGVGIFVVGIMHGVKAAFIQQPLYVTEVFLVSSLLIFLLYIVATMLFWCLGPSTAIAIGLVSGNCNMGLMYLVLLDQAPMELLIFFSIGQIPMYFLPSLMGPVINKILQRQDV